MTIKYYKKVSTETEWEQPILSSNGILGGDEFAVNNTSGHYGGDGDIYILFDGKNNTGTALKSSNSAPTEANPQDVIIYNPNPLIVTNIAYTNWYGSASYYGTPLKGKVLGSNDGSNWTQITTFTNSNDTISATWNISLNDNTDAYKYYHLVFTQTSGWYVFCAEILLTATQYSEVWQECTKEVYNILPPSQRLLDTSNVKKEEELMVSVGNKYYKKVVTETAWTMPTLTSNSTIVNEGVITCKNNGGNSTYKANAYLIFNGTSNTTEVACETGLLWYEIKFPYQLRITGLKIKNGYYAPGSWYEAAEIKVYTDSSMTTQIGSTLSNLSQNNLYTVQNIPQGGVLTDTLYIRGTQPGYAYNLNIYGVGITATQYSKTWQECSAEEYEEGITYKQQVITETAWVQPVLSANGTLGGNSFAVYVNNYASSSYGTGQAFEAFDGNTVTYWNTTNTYPVYILFYNPNPLKVSSIYVNCHSSYYFSNFTVYGSNDNSMWTPLISGSATAQYTMSVNSTEYYHYYKIQSNSKPVSCYEVQITATELTETYNEVSKQIYDLLPPSQRSIDTSNVKMEEIEMVSVGEKYYKKTTETIIDSVFDINNLPTSNNWNGYTFSVSSVNSSYTDRVAYKAIEGVSSSGWTSNGAPAWWQVTFSEPKIIKSFSGDFLSTSNVSYYIQGLLNGTWVTLTTVTNGGNKLDYDMSENAIAYEGLKLYVSATGGSSSSAYFKHVVITEETVGDIWQESTAEEYEAGLTYYQLGKENYANYNVTGSPTINNYVASDFSSNDYIRLPQNFDVSNGKTWEMGFKVTTDNDVSTAQYYLATSGLSTSYDPIVIGIKSGSGFYVSMSTANASGNGIVVTSNITPQSNTAYMIKVEFTGTAYNLYIDNVLVGTTTSSSSIWTSNLILGVQSGSGGALGSPWLGSIDLKECYINVNGQRWWDITRETYNEVSKQIYNLLPPSQRSIDTSNVKKENILYLPI